MLYFIDEGGVARVLEGIQVEMQMSEKGYNRTQKWKIEENDRVERYNSISDKTLRIPSSSVWIAVGAK